MLTTYFFLPIPVNLHNFKMLTDASVQYQCSCGGWERIESLYLCNSTHCKTKFKCQDCVTETPISAFCPQCMFEVPTASVKSEKGCCARNCLNCPLCFSSLLVISEPENKYGLECPVCFWSSSSDIGLCFEKPTGLTALLFRNEVSVQEKEYDKLRDYYEKIQRIYKQEESRQFDLSLSKSYKIFQSKKEIKIAPYSSDYKSVDQECEFNNFRKLEYSGKKINIDMDRDYHISTKNCID